MTSTCEAWSAALNNLTQLRRRAARRDTASGSVETLRLSHSPRRRGPLPCGPANLTPLNMRQSVTVGPRAFEFFDQPIELGPARLFGGDVLRDGRLFGGEPLDLAVTPEPILP